MLGLLELTLPVAYILAGLTSCPDAPPTEVDVRLHASDAPLDTSMTRNELTRGFANNPDSSLATEPGWKIGGLALSEIQARTGAEFKEIISSDNTGCFWVHKVTFDIVYTPVIYIASDYLHDKCHYTLTLAHEQRHVGTDLKTFNDYTPVIRQQLQRVLAEFGSLGPFYLSDMKEREEALLDVINDAVQPVIDELTAVRRDRQAQFDTRSNYLRESALCEDTY